jgi:uncharacterized membrane protein
MSAKRKRRYGAALFWIGAGSMHFARPRFYEAIVPPALARRKHAIVVASGIAELAGGLAILPQRSRRLARGWLLATLIAVYPANIYMALPPQRFRAIPRLLLWARLPLQGLFAWITWRGTE